MYLRQSPLLSVSLIAALGILFSIPPHLAGAHEGEEHAGPEVAAGVLDSSGRLSVSGSGDAFDLTILYQRFKPGESVELNIFLADLETNRPVSNAEMTLTLTGPDTDQAISPVPVADSAGEYRAEVEISVDADYSFLVEVSTEDSFDLFSVDGFAPPPPEELVQNDESSFSVGDYQVFFIIAGFIIVGLVAYSLGVRERQTRAKKLQKAESAETGEST